MSKNISGIYNYCDRWCERCTFTSRCAIYDGVADLPPEEGDIKNKAFWDRLSKNVSKAQDLLQKASEDFGVDLDDDSEEMEEGQKRERIKIESREHPLSVLSFHYASIGRDWLKTQPGMLERLDNLKTEITLGVESPLGAKKETETIKDSLAVIHWYLTFIHVKIVRALMSKLSYHELAGETEFQHDFDGSAKIALIAIDRSMQAWSALFEILPEKEDEFLKILSILEKLKAMAEAAFPNAQAFIRPGFDED
jgi:hypothetical protein